MLNPWVAAAVAGALAGLVGVAVVYLAQRGCEVVRGVGSCGGGIGLVGLLSSWRSRWSSAPACCGLRRVSDPTSTSLLGVGLVAVVVLLFLLDATGSVVDGRWCVPVLTALTFLLALWVTTHVRGERRGRRARGLPLTLSVRRAARRSARC